MAGKKSVNMVAQKAEDHPGVKQNKEHKARKPLSPVQKGSGLAFGIVRLLLTAWALWDIKRRPNDEINGKKRSWMMTSFIPLVGPVTYFIFGRKRERMQLAA